MKPPSMRLLLIVFSLCFATVIFLLFTMREIHSSTPMSASIHCVGSTANFPCFKNHFESLARAFGPQVAMTDLRVLYARDEAVMSQCHQLGHVIGNVAAEAAGADIAVAFKDGDSFCWSGYYHGVVEEAIRQVGREKFFADADRLCVLIPGKERYSFDYYNCVHGVGHGLMAITKNDVFASLPLCDRLTGAWEQKSCYGGVFMENIMADYRGHGTTDLKTDELMYPCTAVATPYKEQCYLMQTSYALKQNGYDFRAVFKLCALVEPPFGDTCAQSLGRDASGYSVSNVERTNASCALAGDDRQAMNCIVGAVKDFVSYFHSGVEARRLCLRVPERFKNDCFSIAEAQESTL